MCEDAVKGNITMCEGCLAADRTLSKLGKHTYLFNKLIVSLDPDIEPLMCWECISVFNKIYKFQQQVSKAQFILKYKHEFDPEFECLSTLNISNRIDYYDLEIEHKENERYESAIVKLQNIDQLIIKHYINCNVDNNADEEDKNDCNTDAAFYDSDEKHTVTNKDNKDDTNELNYYDDNDCKSEVNDSDPSHFDIGDNDIENKQIYNNGCKSEVNDSDPSHFDIGDNGIENKQIDNNDCKSYNFGDSDNENMEIDNNDCKSELNDSDQSCYNFGNNDNENMDIDNGGLLQKKRKRKARTPKKRFRYLYDVGQGLKDNKLFKKVKVDKQELLDYMEKELSTNYKSNFKMNCKLCLNKFSSEELLRQHEEMYHCKSKKWMCDICKRTYSSQSQLKVHSYKHSKYVCLQCGHVTYSKHLMSAHVKFNHQNLLECLQCQMRFPASQKQEFFKHYRDMHMIFICDYCGDQFNTKFLIERHIRKNHTELMCKECNITFRRYTNMIYHNNLLHSAPKPSEHTYCVECDIQFPNELKFKNHLNKSKRHSNVTKRMGKNIARRKIGTHTEEQMKKALDAIKAGKSIRQAAADSKIAFSTLRRYNGKENPDRLTPNYSVRKIFGVEHEEALCNYYKKCALMFYGLTAKDCRQIAYEMARMNNIPVPESWENNKIAGIEWFRGFRERFPDMSLCKPRNKETVKIFFDNLEKVLSRSTAFADGTRIYNLDEIATSTVQENPRVLALKGKRNIICKVSSGEKGTLVTTCNIISAGGVALPPALIFPGNNINPRMRVGSPPGSLILASPTGWMNSDTFVEVMKHFVHSSGSTKDSPTVLVMDNHESHLSIEALDLAEESGVTVLTLHPYTSPKLQPLDVGIHGPFKSYYDSAMDSWMMRNPGCPVTIYEIGALVGEAFEKSMTPVDIKNSFKKTGIYPFDRNIFSEEDFMTSSVTDRPATEEPTAFVVDNNENFTVHNQDAEGINNEMSNRDEGTCCNIFRSSHMSLAAPSKPTNAIPSVQSQDKHPLHSHSSSLTSAARQDIDGTSAGSSLTKTVQLVTPDEFRKPLKAVVRNNKRKPRVQCPGCDKTYATKHIMTCHYNLVHLEKTDFFCEKCSKYFLNITKLKIHIKRIHLKVPKVKNKLCPHCNRGFSDSHVLRHHIRTHTGERPYSCEHCPAAFAQKIVYQKHVKSKHKETLTQSNVQNK